MATGGGNARAAGRGRRGPPIAVSCLILGAAVLLALPGCGGCRKDPEEADKLGKKDSPKEGEGKEEEKPKPDFELSRLLTRPCNARPDDVELALGAPYKPGHFTSTALAAKTNHFDFVGDMEISATDRSGRPIPVTATPFDLAASRQISLAKKQKPRVFESVLYVPPGSGQALASCRLNWRKGGRRAWEDSGHFLRQMPSYQYHLVVLARFPGRYAYLQKLPCVDPPCDELSGEPDPPYYRVSLLPGDRRTLLPSHALMWTSIAYVLWDDAEPDYLTDRQKQALLDWLHWGGQLIISGPDSLGGLGDSFLASYLPAAVSGSRQLEADDFKEFHEWANRGKTVQGAAGQLKVPPLVPPEKWTGVALKKHPRARFIPGSGELLVERRVGRGRIVVSAFPLGSRRLIAWQGVDEMFNAFLLGHKARRFRESPELGADIRVYWADDPRGRRRFDAALISNLRYFTRDTGVEPVARDTGALARSPYTASGGNSRLTARIAQFEGAGSPLSSAAQLESYAGPGVAAWNDFGPVSGHARTALKSAAQLEIPERSFVLWVIAGYLVVLVPANWAVFRAVGRVEWAWGAAPVIALLCAGVVIRAAQLDIGFARARTEIAVVELQGGYPRAHVTRYTALYTSLTTHYDFHFEDPGAVIQPFPKVSHPGSFRAPDRRTLLCRRGKQTSLLGCHVRSNDTGLVHSEQMLDLGGALRLQKTEIGGLQIVNGTELVLHDACVVRRGQQGRVEASWLGNLEPGGTRSLWFRSHPETAPDNLLCQSNYTDPTLLGDDLSPGTLNLRNLLVSAQGQAVGNDRRPMADLPPGEIRLVAGLKQQISGIQIDPAAPQVQAAGLVVAHLRYGFGEDPKPDENTMKPPPDDGQDDPSLQWPDPSEGAPLRAPSGLSTSPKETTSGQ